MSEFQDVSGSEFQQWIDPLLRRAAGYAYSIVHDREDAQDAVQDAALKGYRGLRGYDRARPFKGWWFAIVRNCCYDLLRRRRSQPPQVALDQTAEPAAADKRDQFEELTAALEALPPAHREVLELRYFGDCAYREIAEALGIPMGTVMSRLHAARLALAESYRKAVE